MYEVHYIPLTYSPKLHDLTKNLVNKHLPSLGGNKSSTKLEKYVHSFIYIHVHRYVHCV